MSSPWPNTGYCQNSDCGKWAKLAPSGENDLKLCPDCWAAAYLHAKGRECGDRECTTCQPINRKEKV